MMNPPNCCSPTCPCPKVGDEGPYWVRIKKDPCCVCLLDESDCTTVSSASTPHQHWLGHCDCECDQEKGGQTGEWSYTYDEEGQPISRSWSGECDSEGPTPDWKSDECRCYCQVYEEGCENTNEIPNPETCECECPLTSDDCYAPTPSLDTELCECVPCNKSPGDCSGGTPSLDTEKCECYCEYDDPNGSNKCPSDLPYLNSSLCVCECPSSVADLCTSEQYFDSASCSCLPCREPCKGSNVRASNCTCECPISESDCSGATPFLNSEYCECYCPSSVAANCSSNETFDSATCSCVYDVATLSQYADLLP